MTGVTYPISVQYQKEVRYVFDVILFCDFKYNASEWIFLSAAREDNYIFFFPVSDKYRIIPSCFSSMRRCSRSQNNIQSIFEIEVWCRDGRKGQYFYISHIYNVLFLYSEINLEVIFLYIFWSKYYSIKEKCTMLYQMIQEIWCLGASQAYWLFIFDFVKKGLFCRLGKDIWKLM